mmetsp:Transcript_24562/g.47792  ORF Transcript_24562/g.47792 Transcript_24562/m.47792 type:complete len:217 (-) Transcript_24562:370-1020(-)
MLSYLISLMIWKLTFTVLVELVAMAPTELPSHSLSHILGWHTLPKNYVRSFTHVTRKCQMLSTLKSKLLPPAVATLGAIGRGVPTRGHKVLGAVAARVVQHGRVQAICLAPMVCLEKGLATCLEQVVARLGQPAMHHGPWPATHQQSLWRPMVLPARQCRLCRAHHLRQRICRHHPLVHHHLQIKRLERPHQLRLQSSAAGTPRACASGATPRTVV